MHTATIRLTWCSRTCYASGEMGAYDRYVLPRVLRPGGKLLFCEHGIAPDAGVRTWQARINPIWRRLAGGCNLNRDIPSILESSGVRVVDDERMYIPGIRPLSYNYWGSAVADGGPFPACD